ncbi:COP9 signalosome [Cokeromyces recurvatus]|uniref:COP9 signalosome n=1 Tax=Cokeromyces recurvatus TaxID=90255 RepID=UPI00221F726D|nr:COP9 signalosome [Cokeromyces recurvatus]KAI7898913.1 COP9 signalosome [Cokeromyces recurvatus]
MDTILKLTLEKNFIELVNTCEQLEIQSAADTSLDLSYIYPIYLASYILIHDLQSARYLHKRILINNASSPEIDAIWRVIVDVIKKNYQQLYKDLDDYSWSEIMQLLIEHIKQDVREESFQLISNIYTSIELSQASTYFGLSDKEVLNELTARGWSYNESTQILYPIKPSSVSKKIINTDNFEKIADIILNLEKF